LPRRHLRYPVPLEQKFWMLPCLLVFYIVLCSYGGGDREAEQALQEAGPG